MTIHPPQYLQDKGYTAREDRMLLSGIWPGEGIFDTTHLVASQVSGYQVQVTAGRCLVQGDTNANQGLYHFWSDSTVTVTHTPDATNPRVDLIVARVNDFTEVGSGADNGTIEIVQGTATAGANLTNLTGAPGQGGGPAIPASACPLWYDLVPTSGGVTQFKDARPSSGQSADRLSPALASFLGASQTGSVRRGFYGNSAEEQRISTTYGYMATPDRIQNVVVPANAYVIIGYDALWRESVAGAARAAIFIGSNQLQIHHDNTP